MDTIAATALRGSLAAQSLAKTWEALVACGDRGIHILDDGSNEIVYRSYAQIAADAEGFAAHLAANGVSPGSAVLLSAETSPQFPMLWLALLWLGCTPMPMPPSYSLLGERAFADRIAGVLRYASVYLCADADVEQVCEVCEAGEHATRVLSLSALYREFKDGPPALPLAPFFSSQPDIAFIQFTSGSTRSPKGIRITYGNLYGNVASMCERMDLHPASDRLISWLPLYHDMGLVGKFLTAVLTQTQLTLTSPQFFSRRPLQFLELLTKCRPQFCSMPNFAYEWILKRLGTQTSADFCLSSLKWLGVGAEPVNPRAMAEFESRMTAFGLRPGVLSPCYGLAEATLAVTMGDPGRGFELASATGKSFVTCGRVVADMKVEIVDGPVGRIKIAGESVAQTALVDGQVVPLTDEDGFYDTKDVGYFVEGELVVLGRADEMFIVGGANYFPYDIESAVRDLPGVMKRRAMCFYASPPDNYERGEVVVLYETAPLAAASARVMEESIRGAVARHTGLAIDKVIAVSPRSIPVTSSGKLQRLKARELYRQGKLSTVAEEALPV